MRLYRAVWASVVIGLALSACGPSTDELVAVDYAPQPEGGWAVSTPEQQGLDADLVARLYLEAEDLERLYSVLVVKDGFLIGEKYFNEGAIDQKTNTMSVSKSFVGALVGQAIERGCLSGVDERMADFFPEYILEAPKNQITVEQMLQMRAGYPWEETDERLFDALLWGDFVPRIADFPLTADPGTAHQYSNLTAHWLGVIVARACDTDLKSFAEQELFEPLGLEVGRWTQDLEGYYVGFVDMHFTARELATFGLVYLNGGRFHGTQVIPADWVEASLRSYSENAWDNLGHYEDVGYGYQWWTADAGNHPVMFAWGHGGQQITLVPDQNMIVVAMSDPFYKQPGSVSWPHEKAALTLVSRFIASLPD